MWFKWNLQIYYCNKLYHCSTQERFIPVKFDRSKQGMFGGRWPLWGPRHLLGLPRRNSLLMQIIYSRLVNAASLGPIRIRFYVFTTHQAYCRFSEAFRLIRAIFQTCPCVLHPTHPNNGKSNYWFILIGSQLCSALEASQCFVRSQKPKVINSRCSSSRFASGGAWHTAHTSNVTAHTVVLIKTTWLKIYAEFLIAREKLINSLHFPWCLLKEFAVLSCSARKICSDRILSLCWRKKLDFI